MSLTQRDETDLAGLASELGDADSDARARHLMETDAEAAEFFRQITSIQRVLKAEGESCPPALSAEETDALAAVIGAKARQAGVERSRVLYHPWRWAGAAAAVVAIAVGTWFQFGGPSGPVVAQAVSFRITASLNREAARNAHGTEVRVGQAVVTAPDEYSVLKLTNGSRAAVERDSRLVIGRAARTIELQRGAMFIQAAKATEVRTDDVVISLEPPRAAAVIQIVPDGVICAVHAGQARITRAGHDTQLLEGQQAGLWKDSRKGVEMAPLGSGVPEWVKDAFETAGEPLPGGMSSTTAPG
jgi:hypothetical protein